MAKTDPTPSRQQSLTAPQIEKLADRLFARGSSVLMKDAPSLSGDMRTASRVLRQLLCEVDRLAAIAGDRSRTMANLTVTVEG